MQYFYKYTSVVIHYFFLVVCIGCYVVFYGRQAALHICHQTASELGVYQLLDNSYRRESVRKSVAGSLGNHLFC